MFDNFNVNLRKNEGFLTYIPYIPIPEYGQSNSPLNCLWFFNILHRGWIVFSYSWPIPSLAAEWLVTTMALMHIIFISQG